MNPLLEVSDIPLTTTSDASSETAGIRVAIVEDDERMRPALVFQLETAGFQVTPYGSAEGFFAACKTREFDCVVADIYLPRMNGLQLQEALRRTLPYVSVVFITGHGDLAIGMQAMRNGAVDFFEKPIDDEALLASIIRAAGSSRRRHAEQNRRAELEKRKGALTARELEVFVLVTAGLQNKQIGAELGATERTVKAHRGQVMGKMRADSLADLVRMAGILEIHTPGPQSDRTGRTG